MPHAHTFVMPQTCVIPHSVYMSGCRQQCNHSSKGNATGGEGNSAGTERPCNILGCSSRNPCLARQSVRVLGFLDTGSGFRDPGSGVWAQGTGIPDPISGVCAGSAGPGSGIVGPRGTGMTMPTHPRPNLLRTVTTFEELASIYNGDRKGLEEILCHPVTPHMADAASLTRGNVDWNRCQIASDRLASANDNFRHFPRGYRKRKRRSCASKGNSTPT